MTGLVLGSVGLWGWDWRGFHPRKRETRAFLAVTSDDWPTPFFYFNA